MIADRREEGAVLTHRTALERKRQLKNSLCTKKKKSVFPFLLLLSFASILLQTKCLKLLSILKLNSFRYLIS